MGKFIDGEYISNDNLIDKLQTELETEKTLHAEILVKELGTREDMLKEQASEIERQAQLLAFYRSEFPEAHEPVWLQEKVGETETTLMGNLYNVCKKHSNVILSLSRCVVCEQAAEIKHLRKRFANELQQDAIDEIQKIGRSQPYGMENDA